MKIAKPSVIKTAKENGIEHWQISGDPTQVREILEGKLRKQIAFGKNVTLEDGTPVRIEDLDRIFAENTTTIVDPSVFKTTQHDYLEFARFFRKLALAMEHLHFGESFSRSATGDRLRHSMTAQMMEDATLQGHIWPKMEPIQGALNMIAKENHHTLVIMEGEVPTLLVSLFGEIGAMILLGEASTGRMPRFSDKGLVWRIALPSRLLTQLILLDMIEDRLAPLRKVGDEDH